MSDRIGVLIVEDSEAERFFLRRTIEQCRPGCCVTEFAYAADALDHLAEPDRASLQSIFVDINMPRMDGFAFAEAFAMLSSEQRGVAQIWMVSHSIDPQDRQRAEAHPAIAGFLSKSYQRADIDRVLPLRATG